MSSQIFEISVWKRPVSEEAQPHGKHDGALRHRLIGISQLGIAFDKPNCEVRTTQHHLFCLGVAPCTRKHVGAEVPKMKLRTAARHAASCGARGAGGCHCPATAAQSSLRAAWAWSHPGGRKALWPGERVIDISPAAPEHSFDSEWRNWTGCASCGP